MDIRSLLYFQAVARLQSINKAANELGISQPALSRQIRFLEEEVGSQLFLRHGRGVILNDAGSKALGIVDKILVLAAELQVAAATHSPSPDEKPQRLVLGIAGAPANLLARPLVEEFSPNNPDIILEYRTAPNETLKAQLLSGELDVAVLSNQHPDDAIVLIPFVVETIYLARAAGIGEAPATNADLSQFAHLPVLTTAFIRELCERDLARLFEAQKLGEPRISTVDSLTIVHSMILKGKSAYLGPLTTLAGLPLRQISSRVISDRHIVRSLAIRRSDHVARNVMKVIEFVQNTCTSMMNEGTWPGAWPAKER